MSKMLTKEERIKKEIVRLTKVFAGLNKEKKQIALKLINNAAFIAITLEDLQASINANGTIEEYKHGANQHGLKANPDVNTYNSLVKNFKDIMKQLNDLLPKGEQPESDGFDDFINGK